MTTPHRVGRPKLTEEQAWASALGRVERGIKETIRLTDNSECMIYRGNWRMEIAGPKRRTVNALQVVAKASGYDIDSVEHRIAVSCGQRRCVSPDHIKQVLRWESIPVSIYPKDKESPTVTAFKAQLERMDKASSRATFYER